MDPFDEIMIKNYFSFSRIFKRLHYHKKMFRVEFYSRNMTTRIEVGALGISPKGFRPDTEVERFLSCIELIDRRLARYKYRERHFNRYLDKLSFEDCGLLIERFIDNKPIALPEKLVNQVIEEIDEIETAVCFREGIVSEEEKAFDLTQDIEENLERMCDFFAI